MGNEYYVLVNNEKNGPYSLEQVKQQLKEGVINQQMYAWTPELTDWKLISQFPELATQNSGAQGMDYVIKGTTMPLLEFSLKGGDRLYAQTGAMKWMSSGVQMETKMAGGLGGALKRKLTGESAFFAYFTATNDGDKVAFGHTFPGHIIPWNVSESTIICQKRSFLCATEGVELSVHFQRKLGAGFFGGEGFIMQRLHGNGMAYVEIDGESVEIDLAPGQTIKVETSAVGMFEETVQMDITRVKGFKNIFFGGEGLFLTTLTGPGRVWLQTMPIQSMVAEMSSFLPKPSSN